MSIILGLLTSVYVFAGYFKSLGADLVLDMTVAEDLSLLEAQEEFLRRYQEHQHEPNAKHLPMLASSCPGNYGNYFYSTIICYVLANPEYSDICEST